MGIITNKIKIRNIMGAGCGCYKKSMEIEHPGVMTQHVHYG